MTPRLIKWGLLITMLSSASTQAASVNYYLAQKKLQGPTWFMLQTYIDGVGTGAINLNTYLTGLKQKPAFCIPTNLTLNPQNYADMIESRLRKDSSIDRDADILDALIVLEMIDTFPCK